MKRCLLGGAGASERDLEERTERLRVLLPSGERFGLGEDFRGV